MKSLTAAAFVAIALVGCVSADSNEVVDPSGETVPSVTTTTDSSIDTTDADSIPQGCTILFEQPDEGGTAATRYILRIRGAEVIAVLEPGDPLPEIDPEMCK